MTRQDTSMQMVHVMEGEGIWAGPAPLLLLFFLPTQQRCFGVMICNFVWCYRVKIKG